MKEEFAVNFEYGSSVVAESMRYNFTKEAGIPIDVYTEAFGYPEEVDTMKVDPTWFVPALPGMEAISDPVVHNISEAEDLLEEKKREAFIRIKGDKIVQDDNVLITEEECDELINVDNGFLVDEYETYNQFLYDDLEDTLLSLIQGVEEWDIAGDNLDWRGRSGEMTKTLKTPSDVLDIVRGYGDCTLSIKQRACEVEDNTFTIICYHHDCPTGTVLNFAPTNKEN